MSKPTAIAEGLKILLKYEPGASSAAEHDEFFCGSFPPEKMKEKDASMLEALGWMWDENAEQWSIFT